VLMLPAVWTRHEIAQSRFAVTDITAVIVVVSGVVLLGYMLLRRLGDVRGTSMAPEHLTHASA